LIQSAVVGADVKSVTSELFDEAAKKNAVQQTKLRVQLVPPAQPPSPVPEETTPSVTFGADTKSDEEVVQTRTPVMAVASHTQPMQVSSQGFTLLNIILVALLAFLLGYFTKGHIPALDMMKQNITDIVMKHPVLRKMVSG
jgi:K+-sensing histidine kinase KdpD